MPTVRLVLARRFYRSSRKPQAAEETPTSLAQNSEEELVLEMDANLNIASETEKRLVAQLLKLEASEFYLNPNVSLPKLATSLGTNQRYVSYIIKKHRQRDFNGCVQFARINYILKKLEADPTLLDCKISHLAALCGYTSHSKFAVAFRAETGELPSAYIQRIRGDQDRG